MSAGQPPAPSSDTVALVAVEFGLTSVSVSRAPGGHINDSYFVRTPASAYVLQRINRTVFSDPDGIMSNVLTVHRFLDGTLVPAPIPATDGRWLVDEGPDVWRLLERVPAAAPLGSPSSESAGRAGELLGRLHARLAVLDPSALVVTLPDFHNLRRRLDQCRAVIAADPRGRATGCADEIARALAGAELVELAEDLEARTPVRVVHNDAKFDNFLFRDGEAVAIVDLDTLMPGRRFWDVGDLVRSAATAAAEDETELARVSVDPASYRSVVAGYQREVSGAATDAETEAVEFAGAIVTYEQALRFLTDWLAGDVYYRVTRPRQNLDRTRTQLQLLASMPHSPL